MEKYAGFARYKMAICVKNLKYRYDAWDRHVHHNQGVAPKILTVQDIREVL